MEVIMKRSITLWQLTGFAVAALGGTLLHFLYEWTGENRFAALFSSVNESTWEHMKLLFFPMFIFALIQSRFFRDEERFFCIKLRGILLGLALIPVIYYTYNGVIGKSPDWVNIAIFFIAAAIVYIYEAGMLKRDTVECGFPRLSLAVLCLIAVLFWVFTFVTPPLEIFRDPLAS